MKSFRKMLAVSLTLLLAVPFVAFAQDATGQSTSAAAPVFSQEVLDQLLAPIALYPDSLVSQILMACTYPLEIVSADRWVIASTSLTNDEFAIALEAQEWDPSVKSLVNFPQVLDMMNSKLELTQKLGDAFLAQQKDVMATIQSLRQKAHAAGNLKTTPEQTVTVQQEPQVIIIEAADPQIVYVPVYNPTVVYGTWWYASPPYYYYPPSYVYPSAAYSFVAGVAVGAAWGYAWGHCDWHGGDVNVDIDRNTNINNNIDRSKYSNKTGQGGKGEFKHDPSHRKGVSYRDQPTAQKYNRGSTNDAAKSREAYRGRAEQGRQDLAKGNADQFKGRQPSTMNQNRQSSQRPSSSSSNAFSGVNSGSATRQSSSRGQQSLNSSRSGASSSRGSGASRSGGSRGGGGRR